MTARYAHMGSDMLRKATDKHDRQGGSPARGTSRIVTYPLRAYFDTNIFGHVLRSSEYESKLCDAIAVGRISIPLSYLNVEEVVAANPETRIAQSNLILKLANRYQLIMPVGELVAAQINAYARFGRGDPGARCVFRGTTREKVYSDFRGLLLDEDMQSLIHRKIVMEQTRLDGRIPQHANEYSKRGSGTGSTNGAHGTWLCRAAI